MSTKYRSPVFVLVAVVGIATSYLACIAAQDGLESDRQTVRDIYEELIEINTVTDKGDTARAADAMAKRLLDAGFAKKTCAFSSLSRARETSSRGCEGTVRVAPCS